MDGNLAQTGRFADVIGVGEDQTRRTANWKLGASREVAPEPTMSRHLVSSDITK